MHFPWSEPLMNVTVFCVSGQYLVWMWTPIWCTWKCKIRVEVRWCSICSFIISIFVHDTVRAWSHQYSEISTQYVTLINFVTINSHHWPVTNQSWETNEAKRESKWSLHDQASSIFFVGKTNSFRFASSGVTRHLKVLLWIVFGEKTKLCLHSPK